MMKLESAAVGAITIAVATLAAMMLVPIDTAPKGALMPSSVVLIVGLLTGPIVRGLNDFAAAFRAENLMMLALVFWLLIDPLTAAYSFQSLSTEQIELTFGVIGLFGFLVWVSSVGAGTRPARIILAGTQHELPANVIWYAILICSVLGSFYYFWSVNFSFVALLENIGRSRFAASWSRGALGGWSSFVEQLIYFGYALPALTVALSRQRGWRHPTVIVAVALCLGVMLINSQNGGRRIIGMFAGSGMLTWLLFQGRIQLRQMIALPIFVVTLGFTLQTMLEARNMGYAEYLARSERDAHFETFHVDDNFLRLAQIIAIFPDTVRYVGFKPVTYAAVRPIPRVFWENKPIDPGYDLPSMVGVGAGTSLSSSVLGEIWASHGFFAIIVAALILGRINSFANYFLRLPNNTPRNILIALTLMTLFNGFRSLQEFVVMSYALLSWIVTSVILRAVTKRRMLALEGARRGPVAAERRAQPAADPARPALPRTLP